MRKRMERKRKSMSPMVLTRTRRKNARNMRRPNRKSLPGVTRSRKRQPKLKLLPRKTSRSARKLLGRSRRGRLRITREKQVTVQPRLRLKKCSIRTIPVS